MMRVWFQRPRKKFLKLKHPSTLRLFCLQKEVELTSKEREARMRGYEIETLQMSHFPPEHPYIVRLDGHRFSKFTSSFEKPYDCRSNF